MEVLNPDDLDNLGFDVRKLNQDLDRAKSRVFLGKAAAFLGSLLCSLNFIWTKSVETAATDGVHLYFNPEFYQKLLPETRETVLLHELWHVAYLHILRCGSRDPEIWNVACDYVINNALIAGGFSFKGIEWACIDPQYDNMGAEQIYDLIYQQPPPLPPMAKDLIPLPDNQKQKAVSNVVQAVQTSKMAGGKNAGDLPGEIEMILTEFLTPVINWRIVLDRFFNDNEETNWTWARPNRRYTHQYLPSRYDDEGRLEVLNYYLDVSGSITDHDVVRFNSEVKHIKEKYNPKQLNLIQFDQIIQKIDTFNENDRFDKIVIVGRGGTSLWCVREHILETKPTAAIIFSDLECTAMEPIDCPVIWAVVNSPNAEVKFGKLIHVRE